MIAPAFKVDRGVPMPRKKLPLDRYPLGSMEIDESFAVPDDRGVIQRAGRDESRVAHAMRNAIYRWTASRKSSRRFSIRCVVERGAHVVRCWRVK